MNRSTSRRISLLLFCFLAIILSMMMLPASKAFAEKPYVDCSPKEIHPIYWKATLRGTAKVEILETKRMKTVDHGTHVLVTNYNPVGRNTVMLEDGTHFRISINALSIYEHACTKGDFTKRTKTAFVNSKALRSKTGWLIWVSTDRQSLNIFKGQNRHWVFVRKYDCSTGMANWSTPLGRKVVKRKERVIYSEEFESYLWFFLEFGGSGIHKWPGPNVNKYIGREPCSHACVRLRQSAAIWVYKHIPVGTRLFIY